MYRKLVLLILFHVCLINAIFASSKFHIDTTKFNIFPKSYDEKKWKPVVGFDAHRSFFAGTPVKMNGFRFGAEYRGVHRFGFAFYGLKKNEVFVNLPVDWPNTAANAPVKFTLNYAALFYERVFFKSKKWEIALPLTLGGGGLEGYILDIDGYFQRFTASSFSCLSLGAVTKYYVLPWLAPRVGFGYRFPFNAEKSVRRAFNGPYYSFGINILIGELIRTISKSFQN